MWFRNQNTPKDFRIMKMRLWNSYWKNLRSFSNNAISQKRETFLKIKERKKSCLQPKKLKLALKVYLQTTFYLPKEYS